MIIDKDIMYIHLWEEGHPQTGNYFDFVWLFEDSPDRVAYNIADTECFRRVTDLAALQRYEAAKKAWGEALEALWESSVPVTEAPELPPVPEGYVTSGDDQFYYGDWPTPEGGCKDCNHWHVHICDCGGECSCHRRLDGPSKVAEGILEHQRNEK